MIKLYEHCGILRNHIENFSSIYIEAGRALGIKGLAMSLDVGVLAFLAES